MTKGSPLNYRRRGKGRAVILIHGFLGGSGYWAPQLEHLSERLDVIAPDLPGFAGSGALPACDSIEAFANSVVGLADALAIERFAVMGHSMGAMVALQIALDHARRVERLILYGAAASGRLPERFETFEESIRRIEETGVAAVAQRIAASWLVAGSSDPAYALCVRAGEGVTDAAAIATLRAVERWDVRARLGEMRVPTLVMTGDRDRSTSPAEAFALWRAIPHAALWIAPRSAHAFHLEKPGQVNRALAEFLLENP